MDHQQPVPGFLNKTRRKAVKDTSTNPTSAQATKQRASRANPDAATVPQSSKEEGARANVAAAKVSGKRTGGKGAGGMQSADEPSAASLAMVARLRVLAARSDLVDAVEEMHPGAVGGAVLAMVRSAQTAGPSGVADRAALWRVLGMPWVGDNGGSGKSARDLGLALGAAYGEAVSRLEGHRRRVGVTVREPVTLEAVLDNA